MAALGWHAINDSAAGPSTPGTAYVLLHDHASEQAGGGIRHWGFVRGGIGRVTEAMAAAARRPGRRSARGPRSSGRRGRGRASVRGAARVRRGGARRAGALERRPEDARSSTWWTRMRCRPSSAERSSRLPVRGNEHEDQPRRQRAACGAGDDRGRRPALPPRDRRDQPDARRDGRGAGGGKRRAGRRAIPTSSCASRPSTTPPSPPTGITSSRSTSTPSRTRLAEGSWDGIRDAAADRAIAKHRRALPQPPRLDRRTARSCHRSTSSGCWGSRAATLCTATWRSTSSSTSVRCAAGPTTERRSAGLWLCGAGTHPGGGVTGANGRNCAREVIRDARSLRVRRALRRGEGAHRRRPGGRPVEAAEVTR